jgi:WD40 repeat protein
MPSFRPPFRDVPTAAWDRLEQIIRRFERSWRQGQAPCLDDYLPAEPAERLAVLVELVHTDLEYRLKGGQQARVEDYLRRYPELAAEPALAVALIVREYELRRRSEPALGPDEFLRRFPRYRAQLATRLPHPGPDGPGADKATVRPGADASANSPPGSAAPPAGPPGYEVLQELGRGGMGVVYLARQVKANRRVALKMILAEDHASAAARARFATEVEAVARLQHANIVSVYEVGEHQGRPFFSMEHCPRGSLEGKLGGAPQPPREAARLVEILARAVQVAHQHGIVHRDLKPANVLLGAGDVLKITDFGQAKRLDADGGQTHTGHVLGTPSYMAPEQAAGDLKAVGPAADVYALGAILYECLTGRPPFKAASVLDTLVQVRAQEPVPPSRLNAQVPRDLETVCLKCLHKAPPRRYPSAADLAEDLARFLAGEPVRARPVSAWERAVKWARRRPAVAGLLAMSVLAATAVLVSAAGLFYSNRLQEQRDEADRQRGDAEEQRREADRQRAVAESERALARRYLYFSHMNLADRAWEDSHLSRMDQLLDGWLPRPQGGEDVRGFEWHYLDRLRWPGGLTLRRHKAQVNGVAWSPTGSLVSCADTDGVRVWNPRTGGETRHLQGPHRLAGTRLALSRDGKYVACGCLATGDEDEDTRRSAVAAVVWDVAGGQEVLAVRGHTAHVFGLAFSPDGRRLAVASHGLVQVVDVRTGRELLAIRNHTGGVSSVAFSPDGLHLAGTFWGLPLRVWDATTGREVLTQGQKVFGARVAFSPDGRRLTTGSIERAVQVREFPSGREVFTLRGHRGGIEQVSFSPDGKWLATASSDTTVKVWDAQTGREVNTLKGHRGVVRCVAWSPDGRHLVSGGDDRTVQVWEAADRGGPLVRFADGFPAVVAWRPDGVHLATGQWGGLVRILDSDTGGKLLTLRHGSKHTSLALSPDGKRLATAGYERTVKVWDLAGGREALTLEARRGPVVSVAFSPDGRWLASASVGPDGASAGTDSAVQFWDAADGREVRTLAAPNGGYLPAPLAFSPDSRLLACGTWHSVKVWEARTGKAVFTLRGYPEEVWSIAFSPDGRRLASGGHAGTIKVWDTGSGQVVLSLKGHTSRVHGLAFSPDGKHLASGSGEGTVRIWDPETGQQTLELRGHTGVILSVAWSPDGCRLASAADDYTLRIWEATPLSGRPKDGQPKSSDVKRAADAVDRKAAEWVLSFGGRVNVRVEGLQQWLGSGQRLPRGRLQLVVANFAADGRVSDADLAPLQGLTHLTVLGLGEQPVTDAGLASLKGLGRLKVLDLNLTRVSDGGLVHLKGLSNLSDLRLHGTRVGDAGLAHLENLNLTRLFLASTPVSDAGLAHVKRMTRLSLLDLRGTRVTDAGMAHLKGLSRLAILNLDFTRVGDTGLNHLEGLNLTALGLGGTSVSDAGLIHLAALKRLERLSLVGSGIGDKGVAKLHGLTTLRELDLSNTKVTAAGLAAARKALPRCRIAGQAAR